MTEYLLLFIVCYGFPTFCKHHLAAEQVIFVYDGQKGARR